MFCIYCAQCWDFVCLGLLPPLHGALIHLFRTAGLLFSVLEHFWYYYWILSLNVISLFFLFWYTVSYTLKHLDWFSVSYFFCHFWSSAFLILCFRLLLWLFCPVHCTFYFLECHFCFLILCYEGNIFCTFSWVSIYSFCCNWGFLILIRLFLRPQFIPPNPVLNTVFPIRSFSQI